jgi:hypothetical protein
MDGIIKIVILAGLLIGASYLLGTICWQVQQGYELIFVPSLELGMLLLRCLAGMAAVAIASGLVAALVRPFWACSVAFLFAALVLLLGWEVRFGTGLLALLYFLALLLYAVGTARELEERVHFPVGTVSDGLSLLLTVLALIACLGIYFGYAAKIGAEGFSIPSTIKDTFVGVIMQWANAQMEADGALKPEEREKQLAEVREQMERMWLEPIESRLKPYERLIPALLALGLFWTLRTLLAFLAWVPATVLRGLFPLLTLLRVTRVMRETREVERLVIG